MTVYTKLNTFCTYVYHIHIHRHQHSTVRLSLFNEEIKEISGPIINPFSSGNAIRILNPVKTPNDFVFDDHEPSIHEKDDLVELHDQIIMSPKEEENAPTLKFILPPIQPAKDNQAASTSPVTQTDSSSNKQISAKIEATMSSTPDSSHIELPSLKTGLPKADLPGHVTKLPQKKTRDLNLPRHEQKIQKENDKSPLDAQGHATVEPEMLGSSNKSHISSNTSNSKRKTELPGHVTELPQKKTRDPKHEQKVRKEDEQSPLNAQGHAMVEQPPKQEMLEHKIDPSNKSNISKSKNQASSSKSRTSTTSIGGHSQNLHINDPKKVDTGTDSEKIANEFDKTILQMQEVLKSLEKSPPQNVGKLGKLQDTTKSPPKPKQSLLEKEPIYIPPLSVSPQYASTDPKPKVKSMKIVKSEPTITTKGSKSRPNAYDTLEPIIPYVKPDPSTAKTTMPNTKPVHQYAAIDEPRNVKLKPRVPESITDYQSSTIEEVVYDSLQPVIPQTKSDHSNGKSMTSTTAISRKKSPKSSITEPAAYLEPITTRVKSDHGTIKSTIPNTEAIHQYALLEEPRKMKSKMKMESMRSEPTTVTESSKLSEAVYHTLEPVVTPVKIDHTTAKSTLPNAEMIHQYAQLEESKKLKPKSKTGIKSKEKMSTSQKAPSQTTATSQIPVVESGKANINNGMEPNSLYATVKSKPKLASTQCHDDLTSRHYDAPVMKPNSTTSSLTVTGTGIDHQYATLEPPMIPNTPNPGKTQRAVVNSSSEVDLAKVYSKQEHSTREPQSTVKKSPHALQKPTMPERAGHDGSPVYHTLEPPVYAKPKLKGLGKSTKTSPDVSIIRADKTAVDSHEYHTLEPPTKSSSETEQEDDNHRNLNETKTHTGSSREYHTLEPPTSISKKSLSTN